MIIWPEAWLEANARFNLDWRKVRFDPANAGKVDAERGIYAFAVSIDAPNLPPHGCIVYVGITGDKQPRTLRQRYSDYIRELRRGKSKRPLIDDMMRLWGGHLDFWFSPVPSAAVNLKDLEAHLNSAIVTPLVQNDFLPQDRPLITKLRSK